MENRLLDERDNPKALLIPGTLPVPLPVHKIVNMHDSSDSEDNLPSTIDFDALKGPGLPETSFQNVMTWRGGTPRVKQKQMNPEDENTGTPMSKLLIEVDNSISDASKNATDSTSGSDNSESGSESSSNTGSSSGSSASSASSGSESESEESSGSDSEEMKKQGKRFSGASHKRVLKKTETPVQNSKDAQSISNSSTSSRGKNRKKSFTPVNYKPGSLKLRLSTLDPNQKESTAEMTPTTPQKLTPSPGSKWKTARLTNGGSIPYLPPPTVNGNDESSAATPTPVSSKSSRLSLSLSRKSEPRRVTRQSLSQKVAHPSPPVTKSLDKNYSPQRNGLTIASSSNSELTLSPAKPRKDDTATFSKSLPFHNNSNFVPVGQTSQLTDSVTMTRVSAPAVSSHSMSDKNVEIQQNRSFQHRTGNQDELSDPVLYLTKKNCDLSIYPISPDKNKSWEKSGASGGSKPKVVITKSNNLALSEEGRGAGFSRRLSRRSTDKSDAESWDSSDLGVKEAIRTMDSVMEKDRGTLVSSGKKVANGCSFAPFVDNYKIFGLKEAKIRLSSNLELQVRQVNQGKDLPERIPRDHNLKQNSRKAEGKRSVSAPTSSAQSSKVEARKKRKTDPLSNSDVKLKTSSAGSNSKRGNGRINKLSIFNPHIASKNLRASLKAEESKTNGRKPPISLKQTHVSPPVSKSTAHKADQEIRSHQYKTEPVKPNGRVSGKERQHSPSQISRASMPSTSGGVRTKAAKKYIPEQVPSTVTQVTLSQKPSDAQLKGSSTKRDKTGRRTRSKQRKSSIYSSAFWEEFCKEFQDKCTIDDSLLKGNSRKAKRRATVPIKNKEIFTFSPRKYGLLTAPFPLHGSPQKSKGSTEVSVSKSSKRKRGSILPKCRSNSSLDGTESTTDLQKLPLKKRHAHGNHHYDGPADEDGSQDEGSYIFGAIRPLISPLLSFYQHQKAAVPQFIFGSNSFSPQFTDFVKKVNVYVEGEELLSLKPKAQGRGRPRKSHTRGRPPKAHSLPVPVKNKGRSLASILPTAAPYFQISSEGKRATRQAIAAAIMNLQASASASPKQGEDVLEDPEKDPKPKRKRKSPKKSADEPMSEVITVEKPVTSSAAISAISPTAGKVKVVERRPDDEPDMIDADAPIEIIDIADTTTVMETAEPETPARFLNTALSTGSSGRKKRKANRTGFPTVKKKKRKINFFSTSLASSLLANTELAGNGTENASINSDEEEEEELLDLEENDYSFCPSLTERVKIRRRNSVDSITKEEREQIAAGIIRVPGVIPSYMDVPDAPLVLPIKENYLQAGLMSVYYKTKPPPIPAVDPNLTLAQLVALCGGLSLTTETFSPEVIDTGSRFGGPAGPIKEDYELPYDIWCLSVIQTRNNFEDWARKEEDRRAEERRRKKSEAKIKSDPSPHARKRKVQMPEVLPDSWNFKKLRSNAYFGFTKPPASSENDQLCDCKDSKFKCTSDDCLNRVVFTECPPSCGENCMNRRIQKHEWSPNLKRFLTEEKGYGVKSSNVIKKGDFVLEYVGEVVSASEFRRRMVEIYQNDTHHYCLQLDSNRVIDGHRSGGEGRFVNHSCEPNCEMQKWCVQGLHRMALFALRDIPVGEELSYDYNFSLYNETEGQPCYCKSTNCRGVIGGKHSKASKNENRRKNAGRQKGPQGESDVVMRQYNDPQAKVRVLSKKEVKFVRSGNVFLIRNYEKIRISRSPTNGDEEKVTDRVEKLMTGWISRCRVGSSKYKSLVLTGEDPKVVQVAKMAQILYEVYRHITTAKDDSGRLVCDFFMEFPTKRSYPVFHSVIQKSKHLGFVSIEKSIIRGEYRSLQALEDDIRIVLTTFAAAYEAEKPEATDLVDTIKNIYKEAKTKAVQLIEPFIVTPLTHTSPVRRETKPTLPPFVEYQETDFQDTVRCICGTFCEEGLMIQCEKCLVWQHCDCMRAVVSSGSDKSLARDTNKTKKRGPKKKKDAATGTLQRNNDRNAQEVEFDGTVVSTKEEIPLQEPETTDQDISEMETQIIVAEEAEPSGTRKKEEDKPEPPYFCEICQPREVDPEVPLGGSDDTPDRKYYLTLRREDGLILRLQDTVYVLREYPEDQKYLPDGVTLRPKRNYLNAGPLIKEECDIFRIESLWKDANGNRMVAGYNYLRPHETHHEASRRFFPNEILKAPINEAIPVSLIHGRCWVLDPKTYCKGRPTGCIEEHLYICDMRVNKQASKFEKIKKGYMVCTKPFAFKKFVFPIEINRNVHPHGPPSPDFKSRPAKGFGGGNEKTKTQKIGEQKSKLKGGHNEVSQNDKKRAQREELHAVVTGIESRIDNFFTDPVDMSHLLLKPRKFKSSR